MTRSTVCNRFRIMLIISLIFGLMISCGGDEAYYEEDEAPADIEEMEGEQAYIHPSGSFSMLPPFGAEPQEEDNRVVFIRDSEDALVFALYTEAWPEALDEDTLPDIAFQVADSVLSASFDSFELYNDEAQGTNNGYLIPFSYTSSELWDGDGEMFVTEDSDTLYALFLITQDYGDAEGDWIAIVDSFTPYPDALVEETDDEEEQDEEANEDHTTVTDVALGTGEVADSGFRPEVDGFSFENYGDDIDAANLTAVELERMFGDQVCSTKQNGECILTPPARQWMKQINEYMAGGHCEGMAVLSQLMYYGQMSPSDFGGKVTHDLEIMGNEALQREIAYWWVTQSTYPGRSQSINESPEAVVDTLIDYFNMGKDAPEWWAMGIYQSNFEGGHAITPIGVEDKGNGLYNVLVYDNNWPDETRIVEVDTNENTWRYQASTNPNEPTELYDGDADLQNLEIVAISPRLEPQSCDFCAGYAESRIPGLAAPAQDYYEIWLTGNADLLIEDEEGRRIGYADGEFVNEIPGATGEQLKFAGIDVWDVNKEPVYHIPVGVTFDIWVDGTNLEEAESSSVALIGPGYNLVVEDIWLEPGERDSIGVYIDGQRHQLTYITDYAESPVMVLGVETDAADYEFVVQATEITGMEDTFDVAVDLGENDFIINTSYNEEPVTFDMWMLRIDDAGEQIFAYEQLVMDPENTAYMNYMEWEGEGSVMYLDLDYENDGEIDESIELPDMADEYYDYEEEE